MRTRRKSTINGPQSGVDDVVIETIRCGISVFVMENSEVSLESMNALPFVLLVNSVFVSSKPFSNVFYIYQKEEKKNTES